MVKRKTTTKRSKAVAAATKEMLAAGTKQPAPSPLPPATTKDDGGPIYPFGNFIRGMSLRDWLAGHAVTGLVNLAGRDPLAEAALAYRYADAMLVARKNK